jgi:hypothetical protein
MADFGPSGTQILVSNSSSDGTGEWPLLTQGEVSGPIVALNFTSTQQAGIGPHQRWAVGLLADNASLPNAPNNSDGGATGISYSDRTSGVRVLSRYPAGSRATGTLCLMRASALAHTGSLGLPLSRARRAFFVIAADCRDGKDNAVSGEHAP